MSNTIFYNNLSKLDDMYRGFLQRKHTPFVFNPNLGESLTFHTGGLGIDNRKEPEVVLTDIEYGSDSAPYRIELDILIPYNTLLQLFDYETGIFIMSNIKNQVLRVFNQKLNMFEYRDISFISPNGKIFKERPLGTGCYISCRTTKLSEQDKKERAGG